MNPEIQKLNEEIGQDNDTIDATLNKVKELVNQMNENFDKIKTYLQKQRSTIKNPYAQRHMLSLEAEFNKIEQSTIKVIEKISAEQEKPQTKLYGILYTDPDIPAGTPDSPQ